MYSAKAQLLLMHLLDHPLWSALTTVHAPIACGGELARRYPRDMGPLAAVREQTPAAYDELATLFDPGEVAVQFLSEAPKVPPSWRLVSDRPMEQMISTRMPDEPARGGGSLPAVVPLTVADVPEMIALARLTEPGPFEARTIEFGGYLGIRDGGKLVAMAGQRLAITGHVEVSAVCTHPDYRGRGYSETLVAMVARAMYGRQITPILDVLQSNVNAIRVYERVGFIVRKTLRVVVVLRSQ
jgi:predicted GNAT family acetyltransferase